MENVLNSVGGIFDGFLVLALLILAWKLLRTPALFNAIVLFISFGLIMSLAWIRLNAADIALAEAAIGAGVTGALFLAALGRLRRDRQNDSQDHDGSLQPKQNNEEMSKGTRTLQASAIAGLSVIVLTFILGWAVWTLPPYSDRMRELVFSKLGISGVENPVTAVLLNFRGYDTLLEIGVLLLAALSVLSISPKEVRPTRSASSQFQILLLRLLLPFFTLVGGYILWIGKSAPGGAFQAGAILAAGGILLVASAGRFNQSAINCIPFTLTIGLQTFLLVALATMVVSGNFLQYPADQAGLLILVIEAAAAISIAIALILMFIGGKPSPNPEIQTEEGRTESLRKEHKAK